MKLIIIAHISQTQLEKVILANNAGKIADTLLGGDLTGASAATAWPSSC